MNILGRMKDNKDRIGIRGKCNVVNIEGEWKIIKKANVMWRMWLKRDRKKTKGRIGIKRQYNIRNVGKKKEKIDQT